MSCLSSLFSITYTYIERLMLECIADGYPSLETMFLSEISVFSPEDTPACEGHTLLAS